MSTPEGEIAGEVFDRIAFGSGEGGSGRGAPVAVSDGQRARVRMRKSKAEKTPKKVGSASLLTPGSAPSESRLSRIPYNVRSESDRPILSTPL